MLGGSSCALQAARDSRSCSAHARYTSCCHPTAAGQHPHWLVASRGSLVAHPHFLPPPAGSAPGAQVLACGAAGFTPFHNVNCPHGYIVATSAWVLVGVCWGRLLLADLTIGSTTAGLDRHTRASMPACYLQVQSGCLCSSPVAAAGGARSGIQISQLPGRTRLDAPWPRQVRLRMPLDFGPAGEPAAAAE